MRATRQNNNNSTTTRAFITTAQGNNSLSPTTTSFRSSPSFSSSSSNSFEGHHHPRCEGEEEEEEGHQIRQPLASEPSAFYLWGNHNEDYITGEDRFASLYVNAQQKEFYLEERRQEEIEYEKQNFFRPQITQKARELARATRATDDDTFERLHQEAEYRKCRQTIHERQSIRQYTFSPKIVSNPKYKYESDGAGGGRVEDRLYPTDDEVRDKRLRMDKLKAQLELQGCTFRPSVNRMTRSSPSPSRGFITSEEDEEEEGDGGLQAGEPVYERLNKYSIAKQMKLVMLKQEADEKLAKELTFSPNLMTHRPPSRGPRRGRGRGAIDNQTLETDVFQRLSQTYGPSASSSSSPLDPECTFRPFMAASLSFSRHRTRKTTSNGRSNNTSSSIMQRLQDYQQRRDQELGKLQERKKEQELQECTFAPKINRRSSSNGRSRTPSCRQRGGAPMTVYDKLALDTKAAIDEKREKERVSRELEGCTFRPLINHWVAPPDPSSTSPRRQTGGFVEDRLLEEGDRAAERLESLRRQKEEEDKAIYTFHPKVMGIHGNFARSPLWPQEASPTNSDEEQEEAAAANQSLHENDINCNINRRRQVRSRPSPPKPQPCSSARQTTRIRGKLKQGSCGSKGDPSGEEVVGEHGTGREGEEEEAEGGIYGREKAAVESPPSHHGGYPPPPMGKRTSNFQAWRKNMEIKIEAL